MLVALAVGPSGLWRGAKAAQVPFGPIVVESIHNDRSPALRSIEPIPPKAAGVREIPLGPLPNRDKTSTNPLTAPDMGLQQAPGSGAMPAPIATFDGVNTVKGGVAPDTQGGCGQHHAV